MIQIEQDFFCKKFQELWVVVSMISCDFLLQFLGEMIHFNNLTNLIEGADTTYELFGRTNKLKNMGGG